MHVVFFNIEESTQGLWRICQGAVVLHDSLRFAPAIRLAHGLARDEHTSSGRAVQVQMICADFTLPLAQYAIERHSWHFAA